MLDINDLRKILFERRHGLTLTMSAAALCLLLACSSSKTGDPTSKKALSGTDESIFLGDTIEKNYDPNVIMKRGEAFFEKEEFAEAIVEYNHFLDLHRNHMLASYAAFRIGESHMKRAKGIERDPEPIQKAIDSFERLRRDYPASRYDGQAVEKLNECHDLLAQMHLFVGQFSYLMTALLTEHRIDCVMHFAALSYVGESVSEPLKYYDNNTGGTLSVLKAMETAGTPRLVFSSTCATYGEPNEVPIRETTPQSPINPYGWSKLASEFMLRDYAAKSKQFAYAALRYFNVAGSAADGSPAWTPDDR